MSHDIGRRGLLKGIAASAGAAIGARLSGSHLIEPAFAEEPPAEKSALLLIYFGGGYNSMFNSAGSFLPQNTFGVTQDNVSDLGNGLIVDKTTLGSVPEHAKAHMASIGVRHGISAHEPAQISNMFDGRRNYAVALASAMGGAAAIKCAAVGRFPPEAPRPAIGAVSYQQILDLGTTINALGGGAAVAGTPGRDASATALAKAQAMSNRSMMANPRAMVSFRDGYDTSIQTLKQPVKPFNFDELASVYTGKATGNSTTVGDIPSRFIGAEMMIRAGINVVTIEEPGWDSHGDTNGARDRDHFVRFISPSLNRFLERTQSDPVLESMNIVTTIIGDFARSLPGSDHQPNVTATVIGKHVKVGTTGRTDGAVGLAPTTPGQLQYWAYLADALKVKSNPFGVNPHKLIA